MREYIQVSDVVCVRFNSAQIIFMYEAEVLHIPTATGDPWIFRDLRTDEIAYVSEGCTVTLKEKRNQS